MGGTETNHSQYIEVVNTYRETNRERGERRDKWVYRNQHHFSSKEEAIDYFNLNDK